MPDFFDPNEQQPTGPRISDAGITYQRETLARLNAAAAIDPGDTLSRNMADMVRRTLTDALALTGQNLEPPVDNRTPAQKLFDHVHAIEPNRPDEYRDIPVTHREFASGLSVPPAIASLVVQDALSSAPKQDAGKVLGDRYEDMLKDVEAVLQRAAHLPEGGRVKASELSPHTLAQLAVWSRHLFKAQQSRPKS